MVMFVSHSMASISSHMLWLAFKPQPHSCLHQVFYARLGHNTFSIQWIQLTLGLYVVKETPPLAVCFVDSVKAIEKRSRFLLLL